METTLLNYDDFYRRSNTDYVLAPTGDTTYDEMVTFYTNMSLDDFEEYIRGAYAAEQEFDKVICQKTETRKDDSVETYSTHVKQKYYYTGNFNYLYIDADTTTVGGSTIYTGDIQSVGYAISLYPAYEVITYSALFASDKKTVAVSYKCVKYISENLMNSSLYTINVTFEAGAGDVYVTI